MAVDYAKISQQTLQLLQAGFAGGQFSTTDPSLHKLYVLASQLNPSTGGNRNAHVPTPAEQEQIYSQLQQEMQSSSSFKALSAQAPDMSANLNSLAGSSLAQTTPVPTIQQQGTTDQGTITAQGDKQAQQLQDLGSTLQGQTTALGQTQKGQNDALLQQLFGQTNTLAGTQSGQANALAQQLFSQQNALGQSQSDAAKALAQQQYEQSQGFIGQDANSRAAARQQLANALTQQGQAVFQQGLPQTEEMLNAQHLLNGSGLGQEIARQQGNLATNITNQVGTLGANDINLASQQRAAALAQFQGGQSQALSGLQGTQQGAQSGLGGALTQSLGGEQGLQQAALSGLASGSSQSLAQLLASQSQGLQQAQGMNAQGVQTQQAQQNAGLNRNFSLQDFQRQGALAQQLGAMSAPQVGNGKGAAGTALGGVGALAPIASLAFPAAAPALLATGAGATAGARASSGGGK